MLFHCATGKDRAGVVAALLLRLLGADDAAIYADYMRTNETLEHELAQAYSLAMAKAGMTKLPPAMYSASSLPVHAGSRLRSTRSTATSALRLNMLRIL